MRRRHLLVAAATLLAAPAVRAQSPRFDHAHGAWEVLLARHVKLAPDQRSSRVDYAGLAADRAGTCRVPGSAVGGERGTVRRLDAA